MYGTVGKFRICYYPHFLFQFPPYFFFCIFASLESEGQHPKYIYYVHHTREKRNIRGWKARTKIENLMRTRAFFEFEVVALCSKMRIQSTKKKKRGELADCSSLILLRKGEQRRRHIITIYTRTLPRHGTEVEENRKKNLFRCIFCIVQCALRFFFYSSFSFSRVLLNSFHNFFKTIRFFFNVGQKINKRDIVRSVFYTR